MLIKFFIYFLKNKMLSKNFNPYLTTKNENINKCDEIDFLSIKEFNYNKENFLPKKEFYQTYFGIIVIIFKIIIFQ